MIKRVNFSKIKSYSLFFRPYRLGYNAFLLSKRGHSPFNPNGRTKFHYYISPYGGSTHFPKVTPF